MSPRCPVTWRTASKALADWSPVAMGAIEGACWYFGKGRLALSGA